MKKLTQHEFIEHLKTLTSRSFFEVAGETWSYNEKDQTWVLNEPLIWFCPICKCETQVSVLDNSAKLDGILICHPESKCINIDYAGACTDSRSPERGTWKVLAWNIQHR